MSTVECKCKGKNPNCEKCFGQGYYENNTAEKKQTVRKPDVPLKEKLEKLPNGDFEKIALEIVNNIDLNSKKQMQILNSIPFRTTTFRIDFKSKFDTLQLLELGKQKLRSDLTSIIKLASEKHIKITYKFNHLLSSKLVDVSSNKELKALIREYKKSKNTKPNTK